MKLLKAWAGALAALVAFTCDAHAAERKPLVIGATGQQQQIQSTDTLKLPAATTANASLNLPHGTAPTSPNDGDCWTTTSGFYCRINGATVGPLISVGGITPGGSSGQVQYNNSGALGGFTLAGDCTLSIPNITCTKASGTSFGYFATGTDAANLTGTLSASRIAANSLALSKLAQIGGNSYLGNTSTSTGDVTAYVWPTCTGAAQALRYNPSGGAGVLCGTVTAVAGGTNPFYIGTPNVQSGIGSPSASTDPVGSLYMRTDTAQLWQQSVASGTVPALVQAKAWATGSSSVTLSATPAAGDLLVAACYGGGVPGAGSGWTDSGLTHTSGLFEPNERIVYKFAVLGESTTQTPCSGANSGAVFEVSGVSSWTDSLEATASGTGSPITYTTANANDLVLFASGGTNISGADPGAPSISGLSGGASTAHYCCDGGSNGHAAGTASQAYSSSSSSVSVSVSYSAANGKFSRLIVLKPASAGWVKVSFLSLVKNAGTPLTTPISLNCSTGTTCADDGLGNITLTASGTGTVSTTGSPASGNLVKFSGATSITSGDLSGDCTTSGALAITCTKTSGTSFGTFATQNYATPPAIGGTTPAAGAFTTLSATGNLTTNVTGTANNCLQASSSGVVSGTGSSCGGGGGSSITFKDEGSTLTTATTSVDCVGTGVVCTNTSGAVTLTVASGGGSSTIVPPQGRLTLVSGTSVLTSDQTAKSTVYYDCYAGKLVPYYDGSTDQVEAISSCEVSLTMQTSGTGVTNSAGVFDVFWVHGGANRICVATNGSGGGWASDTGGSNTARGTGYSQVHNTRGYWTNVNSITHCYNGTTDYGSVSADQATYLGTLYTTAAGQTGMAFTPAAASGGAAPILGLWNAYNRVLFSARSMDSASSWTYTSSTWRASNASNSNRISFVDGLGQSRVDAAFQQNTQSSSGACAISIGIDFDSTSATPANGGIGNAQLNFGPQAVTAFSTPLMGYHYAQAVESDTSACGTGTLYGNAAGIQSHKLQVSLEM